MGWLRAETALGLLDEGGAAGLKEVTGAYIGNGVLADGGTVD